MAFPQVQSVTASIFNTDTTTHNVSMPATVNAGDLLICLFAADGAVAITPPAGWTELLDTNTGGGISFGAYARRADGTEGGTTPNFQTGSAEAAAAQVYRITGWRDSGTLVNDVEIAAAAVTGNNTTPDPPTLDPTNWATEDTLWLAFADTSEGTLSSSPTNYTNGTSTRTTTGGAATTGVQLVSARRELAAASDNPGTFTVSVSGLWIADTIAVRPSGAPPSGVMASALPKATFAGAGSTPAVGGLAAARSKATFAGGGIQAMNIGRIASSRGKATFSGNGVLQFPYVPQHRIWATIYDIDGTTIKGQLMRVLRGSTLREIDALGYFQLVADALDPYADELVEGREIDIYYEGHGVRLRGIIETIIDGVSDDGELTTTVTGMSLGAELLYANSYFGIEIDDLSQASALAALLANADNAWTALVTGSGYQNITARFNNQNLYQAALSVGARSLAYVRETWTKRQLELKNVHTASGIVAANLDASLGVLGSASKIAPIVGELSITRDARELYNRIVPYGRGAAGVNFDLRLSTRSSPYTIQSFIPKPPSVVNVVGHAWNATPGERQFFDIECSGSNRALVILLVTNPAGATDPDAPMLAQIGGREAISYNDLYDPLNGAQYMYALINPPAGINTIAWETDPLTATGNGGYAVAIALADVYQGAGNVFFRSLDVGEIQQTTGTSPSVAIDSVAKDLVLDWLIDTGLGTASVGAAQTLLHQVTAGLRVSISQEPATGASTTMSWTKSSSTAYDFRGIAIMPVSCYYIEDATSVSAKRRRVRILTDIDLSSLGVLNEVDAANTLYDYSADFLNKHKDEALFYSFAVASLPTTEGDLLLPGDSIRLAYRGRVVENGVARLWKTVDAQLVVVAIRELWERDGPRRWQLVLANLVRSPRMDSRLGQLFLAVERQGSAGVLG